MDSIRLKARAKINLGLDVLGKRDDGYHEVRMIMQTVGIYDRIIIKKIPEDEIRINSNLFFLPVNENNLIYKAARMMKDEYNIKEGVEIDLNKLYRWRPEWLEEVQMRLQHYFGMNKIFDLGISQSKLMEMGLKIGADVPYCIMRGTALAEGIGEKLTRLTPMPHCWLIVAKPPINVSTKLVYESLDMGGISKHPDIDGIMDAIKRGDVEGVAQKMGNVLEDVTIPLYPVIDSIKKQMLKNGAIGAMMSGSGPTVFGIFPDEQTALGCQAVLKAQGEARQVYITETFN